jgi:carbonic anhydrase/acetyltransferase-like protein (isoleucine patch superfamily)
MIGDRASLWPFTCLRGDGGATVVGAETNVQEFTMLHGAILGDKVTVGHNAVVDYATVEDYSLVGMGSRVLRDATVESDCIVAAGAVVLQDQTIPEGHLAYGAPAETKPLTDAQHDEIDRVHKHYVGLGHRYKTDGGVE